MEIVFVILALVIGAGITFLVISPERKRLNTKYDNLLQDYHSISVQKGELSSRCEELSRQISELKDEGGEKEQRLKNLFENISNKIIEESRQKMEREGTDRLKAILTPLGDNIERFKARVEQVYGDEAKERHSLERELKRLVEMNIRISEDANNLTNALKNNNKTQGNWGEMILETILENSGLMSGREGYELQNMLRDSEGKVVVGESGRKMIPDAIVHFPDNRNVIIDSKVSLAAYIDYCNGEDKAAMELHKKRHIDSVRNHIKELDIKSYEKYVDGSLDFVMMFIPNESAYILAITSEPMLWNEAYKKKILLISPSSLISSLKIAADLWTREKQNKNVEEIIAQGERIYDKCAIFVDSFVKIESNINTLSTTYQSAKTSLTGKGSLLRQAEKLRELGVKSKKRLTLKSVEKELETDEKDEDNE